MVPTTTASVAAPGRPPPASARLAHRGHRQRGPAPRAARASASRSRSAAAGAPVAAGARAAVTLSMPSAPICASASRRAPSPTDDMAVTAATPNTTPRMDSVGAQLVQRAGCAGQPQQHARRHHGERLATPRGRRAGGPAARPARASASLWVTSTSVRPSPCSSSSRSAISSPVAVSRLPVGSSARSRRGSRHQRARDGRALRLAARELGRPVVRAVGEADPLEARAARARATRRRGTSP